MTGSPHVHGNSVTLGDGVSMTVSICAKKITVCTCISDYSSFANGLYFLMASFHTYPLALALALAPARNSSQCRD